MDSEGFITLLIVVFIAAFILVIGMLIGSGMHDIPTERCNAVGYVLQQEVVSTAPNNKCILIGDNGNEYVITIKGD